MSTNSLGELFVKLGFVVDQKPLTTLNQALTKTRSSALLIGTAFAGATYGLNKFLKGTLDTVSVYNQFNQKTGLSIDKLQEFQSIAMQTSASLGSDEVIGSLESLNQKLQEIKMGKGDLTPFYQLNVNPFQDAFGVIENLRGSVKKLDDSTATNLLEKIGLTSNFLPMLKKSQEEMKGLSKGIVLTAQQRESINRLNLSIKNTTFMMKQLKDQAVAKLAPELNKLVSTFFQWMVKNGDKIVSAVMGIADVFVKFTRAVGNTVVILSDLLNRITGTEKGIKILAMGITLLMLSFRPLLALMVGIIALFDDFKVWKEGGESLFGGLYEILSKTPSLITVLGGLALIPFLKKVGGLLGGLTVGLGGISKLGGIGKLGVGIAGAVIGDKMKSSENQNIKAMGGGIQGAMLGATLGSFVPGVGNVLGAGLGFAGGVGYEMYKNKQNKSELNSMQGGYSQGDVKNINNTFNVNIDTKADGEVIADDFMSQIKRLDYKLSY
jgi:hypothetical protein